MTWFWLNIPLAALFFLAWTLVPLWMVINRPDTGPDVSSLDPSPARGPQQPAPVPAAPRRRQNDPMPLQPAWRSALNPPR